jgi:uncharacterized protein YuzE
MLSTFVLLKLLLPLSVAEGIGLDYAAEGQIAGIEILRRSQKL